jgi:hypothetical protein
VLGKFPTDNVVKFSWTELSNCFITWVMLDDLVSGLKLIISMFSLQLDESPCGESLATFWVFLNMTLCGFYVGN